MQQDVQTFFSNSGPLALAFPDYQIRQSQVDMSCMIASLFQSKGFNCIEAETGIGKTFAYLVPAIYQAIKYKQKIVISTHTIALQEQLYHKDIPLLLELLGITMEVVLVKGMGNYLCHEKFYRLKSEPAYFKNPHMLELDTKLSDTANESYEVFSESLPKDLWHKLSADSLSCLSHTCPSYKVCHFFNARKPVEQASILIVNHHLLLTDLAVKDDQIESSIIPGAHHLILDEAHHIPDIAEQLFSFELSLNTLEPRFKPKILKENLAPLVKALKKQQQEALVFFCDTELDQLCLQLIETLNLAFDLMAQRLGVSAGHLLLNEDIDDLLQLFSEAEFILKNLTTSLDHLAKTLKELELHEKYRVALFIIDKLKKEASGTLEILGAFKENKKDKLFFYEKTVYNASFKCHYIHASKKLGNLLSQHYLSTTFCSATLTFDLNFDSFKQACGLTNAQQKTHEARFFSDFNFKEAMLFAIPSDMPEPAHEDYEAKLYSFCYEVIKATRGGVFILFTSYDQLFKMAEKIRASDIHKDIFLYVQGSDSKQTLLDGFKSQSNSVLLGTDSFWEGVDVQGEKLRCVIITKLPFRSPNDPIFQATAQRLRSEKKDPFFEKALPEACVKFKQGLGRLIRSKEDFGVVICTDMRLINKNYGKYFLKTLPSCQKKLAPAAQIIQAVEQKMKQHQLSPK